MGLIPLEERTYSGLVITSIPVEKREDGKVYFNEKSGNTGNTVFLKDIKQSNESNSPGQCEFSARQLDLEEAKEEIEFGIPLFCVHGFNVEPSNSLFSEPSSYKAAYDKFKSNKKYYPVPVIWASEGNYKYSFDQENNAMNTGKKMFDFVNSIDNNAFPRKSLLMHSMGNHAVFNAACGHDEAPDVEFENIFLVSADIPNDVFHDSPNEDYSGEKIKIFGNKKKKAERFLKMMAKTKEGKYKGKICVVYNNNDRALSLVSRILNGEARIGCAGHSMKSGWFRWSHQPDLGNPDFKGVIENKDFSENWTSDPIPMLNHSYQFDEFAIEYYESKSDAIQQD